MKRGILVATLMMTAAGVASANLLTTVPHGVPSPWLLGQRASEATPAEAKSRADKSSADRMPTDKVGGQPAPVVHSAPKVASSQTTQKALVEPQQAPVPFRMKPRPPVNLPPAADKPAEAKAADKPVESPSDPATGDAAGESTARAAIEADGYKGVKVLRKGANGVWHASALRGKTTVMLTVDAGGSVSAD
jgi:hypothetical protein